MRITKAEPTKEEENERKCPSEDKVLFGGHPDVKAGEEGNNGVENAVWVDAGDCGSEKALGLLQWCLIEKWKTKSELIPAAKVVEAWVREA